MPLEIDLDVPVFRRALKGLPRFIVEKIVLDAAKREGCEWLRSNVQRSHARFLCFRMLPDASGCFQTLPDAHARNLGCLMWSYCLKMLAGVAEVGPGLTGRVANIQIMLSDTGVYPVGHGGWNTAVRPLSVESVCDAC